MASAAYKVQCTTISRILREMSSFLLVKDILTADKRLHVNEGKRVSLLFYKEIGKRGPSIFRRCVCVCDGEGGIPGTLTSIKNKS